MAGIAKLTPSTRLAVLGLLLERPSWGYELDARFKRIFGADPWEWRVTPQAIYNALKRLESDDMIEPIGDETGERSADSKQRDMRQTYRVTGTGAQSMREWLATPMTSSPSQEELLIRLYFGNTSDETLRTMLRRHGEVCLEELERIAALPADTRMQRLVKEDRRLAVQARLSWIGLAPLLRSSSDRFPISDDRSTILAVEQISKRYRRGHIEVAALRAVSMVIAAGEVVCVAGARRSGRTTLMRIIAGMERQDEGLVRVAGVEIAEAGDALRRQVAFCNLRFLPAHGRDACEQVAMPLRAMHVSHQDSLMRACRALEQVGAADLAFTPPHAWVPSEAVRVALARAIVREPRLLIFDEPTNGVDPVERDPLLLLIQQTAHESGIATLLTAGDTMSVTGADRVLRLSDGELLGHPPRSADNVVELRQAPASEPSP